MLDVCPTYFKFLGDLNAFINCTPLHILITNSCLTLRAYYKPGCKKLFKTTLKRFLVLCWLRITWSNSLKSICFGIWLPSRWITWVIQKYLLGWTYASMFAFSISVTTVSSLWYSQWIPGNDRRISPARLSAVHNSCLSRGVSKQALKTAIFEHFLIRP